MLIIKLSGKALHDHAALTALFTTLKAQNEQAVVVHGGGVEVDQILKALDFTSTRLNGIRVSPKEQMPYIAGVLAGQCNKTLQGVAAASGLKAFGMLCTDFDCCSLEPYEPEYGQVAHCHSTAAQFNVVKGLMEQGYTPVICSIGIDHTSGELYNINADEVASALAVACGCPLVFFSDVKGVLDGNGQVIPEINGTMIEELIAAQVITEGMAVKVKSALQVAQSSHAPVFIASIFDESAVANLSSLRRIGTTLRA